ncbi:MAG TPA: hypothetical protein VF918_17690 [Anaerolineales bacterium]
MITSASANKLDHPYPRKIALRAQHLIQGTLFYNVLADTTIGLCFSEVPSAVIKVKEVLIKSGWSEDNYELSLSCFEEYINEFKNPIFQHAIYSIISHWDWYISNLGKFIYFAEEHVSPVKKRDKDLLKLSAKPFAKQIDIVKNQTGIIFEIKCEDLDLIEEMHLVRNLGLHNQWEVDETYLKNTKMKNFRVGKKRLIETPELEK